MIQEKQEYCLLLQQNNDVEKKVPKYNQSLLYNHCEYCSPVPKTHTGWSMSHPVCVLLLRTVRAFIKRTWAFQWVPRARALCVHTSKLPF